jgi:hypothetical protein
LFVCFFSIHNTKDCLLNLNFVQFELCEHSEQTLFVHCGLNFFNVNFICLVWTLFVSLIMTKTLVDSRFPKQLFTGVWWFILVLFIFQLVFIVLYMQTYYKHFMTSHKLTFYNYFTQVDLFYNDVTQIDLFYNDVTQVYLL